jgi:hypothetical protein
VATLFAIRKEVAKRWSNIWDHLDGDFHLLSTHRFQLSRERSKAQLLDWVLDLHLMSSADEFMTLWNRYVRPVLPRLASLTFVGYIPMDVENDFHERNLLRMHKSSIWADLQAAQHLVDLRFVEIEDFLSFRGSDLGADRKIAIPHLPSLRTLLVL